MEESEKISEFNNKTIENIGTVLKNFATFIPSSIVVTASKFAKADLEKEMVKKIKDDGLYHIVGREESADVRINTSRINASKRTGYKLFI